MTSTHSLPEFSELNCLEVIEGVQVPRRAWTASAQEVLTPEALAFLRTPHRWRIALYLLAWMIAVASVAVLAALNREGYGDSPDNAEQDVAANL